MPASPIVRTLFLKAVDDCAMGLVRVLDIWHPNDDVTHPNVPLMLFKGHTNVTKQKSHGTDEDIKEAEEKEKEEAVSSLEGTLSAVLNVKCRVRACAEI